MQLCFVSVHGPRETYFVDEPHARVLVRVRARVHIQTAESILEYEV
jgi:hypothetical protein